MCERLQGELEKLDAIAKKDQAQQLAYDRTIALAVAAVALKRLGSAEVRRELTRSWGTS